MQPNCHILSIAPYRILPPTSGGQLSIVYPQHYLGLSQDVHIISTADNDLKHNYSFQLHPIFPAKARRYFPNYKLREILTLAREHQITHIYCDHPYMAPTAISLSGKLKIPWFLRSQNIESERFRALGKKWWSIMRLFEQYAMRKASGVFFITPEDMEWAIDNYRLDSDKCDFIPFGTILDKAPEGHTTAKAAISKELNIGPDKPWLYFLGALDYAPNEQAIFFILDEIMPRLDKQNVDYQILIAGKKLSSELQERISKQNKINYTGFIPDIDVFLKACDIMLNPIITGGGIKTKAVEALGYNKIVVSSESGAMGIDEAICGGNLLLSPDTDWDLFTKHIIEAMSRQAAIPQSFYDTFYWGNIAQKITRIMTSK